MSKKVLMILSKEYSTDPRVTKEAESIVEQNYQVSVICWDRKHSHQSFETIDKVTVHRIKNSAIMRLFAHDVLRNPLWWWHAYRKGLKLYKEGFDYDIVHCHDLDTLAAGVLLKKKLDIKLIYDAHEIFGYMIEQNMPSIIVHFSFLMEKYLIHFIDTLITADVGYANYFEKLGEKPIIIRNCKDIITETYLPPKNDLFSVIYIGTLSKSRFFPDILSVAKKVNDVIFVIAGKKEALYEQVEDISNSIDNINFLGTIPIKEVIPRTIQSHIVICLFDPTNRLNQIGSPNKLFEAMVCGRPIIASKGTYSGKLVENLEIGLSIDFSKKSLIKAIKKLRDNPKLCEKLGKNALKAALMEYNWQKQKEKLIQVYEYLNR